MNMSGTYELSMGGGEEVVEGESVLIGGREFGLDSEGNGKCAHCCRKLRASF